MLKNNVISDMIFYSFSANFHRVRHQKINEILMYKNAILLHSFPQKIDVFPTKNHDFSIKVLKNQVQNQFKRQVQNGQEK